MSRPIKAIIHTNNMAHNLSELTQSIKQHHTNINKDILTFVVVKANAYGHGMDAALHGFSKADGFSCIEVSDAIYYRQNSWNKRILLLDGFFDKDDLDAIFEYSLDTVVHSEYQLDMLTKKASNFSSFSSNTSGFGNDSNKFAPVDVFIKINTGLNRLGFHPSELESVLTRLTSLQVAGIIGKVGFMTHFANADNSCADEEVLAVFDKFASICAGFKGPVSLCNSAASLRFPQFAALGEQNIIRAGGIAYGGNSFNCTCKDFQLINAKPAMSLVASIIAIQNLLPGDCVGYGSTFTATKPCRVAVVACGYADGYPRSANNDTEVGVLQRRAKVVGRVSMDMMTIDITHIPEAKIGTPVVLWGEGGPTVIEAARMTLRIFYELTCGVTLRVQKIIDNG